MTTDRELLELAAKAASIEIIGFWDSGSWLDEETEWGYQTKDFDRWNPLTDDGDALRLAVRIGIAIDPREYEIHGTCAITDDGTCFIEDPRNNDKYSATRRAIVRAAAEIGKAMQ